MSKLSALYFKLITKQLAQPDYEEDIMRLKEKIALQREALGRFDEFKIKYRKLFTQQMSVEIDDDLDECIPELNLNIDLEKFDSFKQTELFENDVNCIKTNISDGQSNIGDYDFRAKASTNRALGDSTMQI